TGYQSTGTRPAPSASRSSPTVPLAVRDILSASGSGEWKGQSASRGVCTVVLAALLRSTRTAPDGTAKPIRNRTATEASHDPTTDEDGADAASGASGTGGAQDCARSVSDRWAGVRAQA